MKKYLQARLSQIHAAKAAVGAAMIAAGAHAQAAIDLTGVDASITSAESQASTVGGYVIAAVAGLVAIGLIIGIIRKL